MKTAIISDVHGNYPALEAILQVIDEQHCERIVSLGDVAGYYCMINECIDVFRNRGIINLMGNHDLYLIGESQCPRSMTVNKCIAYQKGIITKANLDYLTHSTYVFEDQQFSARHGGWTDPIDEYVECFNFEAVGCLARKVFCSGHTHIQKLQYHDGIVYFNPGSVGQPRDGDARAAFAILEDGKVSLHRAKYSIDTIVEAMRSNGFEDRISECLYYGTKIRTYGVT